jgi:hypothetical protein
VSPTMHRTRLPDLLATLVFIGLVVYVLRLH